MRRLIIATALLLLVPVALAQVYKWTDAHGTVHYSESPPRQGTKFKRITTTGSAEPVAAPSAELQGSSDRPKNKAVEEPPAAPVADTPENRGKLCASLKANLDILKGAGPVVMQQGDLPKALDDTQRQEQIASANAQYAQYCAK